MQTLKIATYNVHKGFSQFKARMIVHELREKLQSIGAEVVFLQEVQGDHQRHAAHYTQWPVKPQYEFLADSVWSDFAYGKNSIYDSGHHGNAILSRFPIVRWENEDVSAHRFESRGLLHCEIQIPGWRENLHCVCVHLGLFSRGRARQLIALERRIEKMVPAGAPLVIAGDFNDWRRRAGKILCDRLLLNEVFESLGGRPAASYPAKMPVFRLDRIYVRGFVVKHAEVHCGRLWSRMSDHAALAATIARI